jgi:hypothetical protein
MVVLVHMVFLDKLQYSFLHSSKVLYPAVECVLLHLEFRNSKDLYSDVTVQGFYKFSNFCGDMI